MIRAGLGLEDIKAVRIPLPLANQQEQALRDIRSALTWLDRVSAEHASAPRLLPKLDQAILAKASRGELVSGAALNGKS
jgi:type I restriction enzyme S subunit